MKKVLSLLLAVVMLLSLFPMAAFAQDVPEELLTEEENVEILSDVVLPSEIVKPVVPEPEDIGEQVDEQPVVLVVPDEEDNEPEVSEGFCLENALYGACDLVVGEKITLYPANLPAGASESDVVYVSSDDSVVTVENGKAYAVSEGTAVITAKVIGTDGIEQTAELVINAVPSGTSYGWDNGTGNIEQLENDKSGYIRVKGWIVSHTKQIKYTNYDGAIYTRSLTRRDDVCKALGIDYDTGYDVTLPFPSGSYRVYFYYITKKGEAKAFIDQRFQVHKPIATFNKQGGTGGND